MKWVRSNPSWEPCEALGSTRLLAFATRQRQRRDRRQPGCLREGGNQGHSVPKQNCCLPFNTRRAMHDGAVPRHGEAGWQWVPEQLCNDREVVITNSGHIKFTGNPGVAWIIHQGGRAADKVNAPQGAMRRPPGGTRALATKTVERASFCRQHPRMEQESV